MSKLAGKRVVLTGASGGIGSEVAHLLVKRGASIVLVGRGESSLALLQSELQQNKPSGEAGITYVAADVTSEADREQVIEQALARMGGIDLLINLAGAMNFTEFSNEKPEITEQLFRINVLAPMHLSRMIVPHMVEKGSGQIVNVGSIFGSIAFAWFASYSSAKFALRGFSEALRRELDGTGVGVTYIAPRAVRTSFNSDQVTEMCHQLKMNMDEPDEVALMIVNALESGAKDKYLGFPEKLFVRINSLFPRLVDKALSSQNREAKRYIN